MSLRLGPGSWAMISREAPRDVRTFLHVDHRDPRLRAAHRSKHELPRREQGETSGQVDVNWVKKSRSNSMSST